MTGYAEEQSVALRRSETGRQRAEQAYAESNDALENAQRHIAGLQQQLEQTTNDGRAAAKARDEFSALSQQREVGPGSYCSPRHKKTLRILLNQRTEDSKCMSTTLRANCICP
jgi:hypothetical protein